MTATYILDDRLLPLEKIVNKNINELTFKEIISLIFHASKNIINDPSCTEWAKLYKQFEKELSEQNKMKWPEMAIIKNDYDKRIDILTTTSAATFIKTENIFMLLLRLLYVENYKRPYIFKSYNYHKILGNKLKGARQQSVKSLSLYDLFDLLQKQLTRYIRIYNDENQFEHQIATSLLKCIV